MRRMLSLLALVASPALAAPVDIGALPATGPAVKCIDETGLQFVIADTRDWLVLRQGKRAWRAALVDGCPTLNRSRIVVRRSTQGRFCSNDLIEVVDPLGNMSLGLCRIGRIEPVAIPRGARF